MRLTSLFPFCIVFVAWEGGGEACSLQLIYIPLKTTDNVIFKLYHLSPVYMLMPYQMILCESEEACLSLLSTAQRNAAHQF